ncbi:MAG: toxin-antitoxin system HicB family antitoxin [Planctomycetota bacterium]|nr:toxin-antitoxin system HicB family antitoxin [Planctomycetota bacterium]
MKDPKGVLAGARHAARTAGTWADLSNALFDSETGLLAKAYPTRKERERFLKTNEYKAIRKLLTTAMRRSGLVRSATPRKSGRFVVRLPTSLHESLELEAAEEGVSLNQLVVYKLAAQLRTPRELRGKIHWHGDLEKMRRD